MKFVFEILRFDYKEQKKNDRNIYIYNRHFFILPSILKTMAREVFKFYDILHVSQWLFYNHIVNRTNNKFCLDLLLNTSFSFEKIQAYQNYIVKFLGKVWTIFWICAWICIFTHHGLITTGFNLLIEKYPWFKREIDPVDIV